jgi:peptidoglycan biosynthesis protein MviN/MurJ (putative lipid II flippase)
LFWSIPIIVLFIVLRAQIVRTIYGAGMFDWNATRLTAAALALFAISLVAQNIILLCVRAHYAMGNTRKPLMYAIIGSLSSLVAVVVGLFIYTQEGIIYSFFETLLKVSGLSGTEVLVLPLAFSIGSIIQAVLLWHSLSYDEFRKAFNIGRSVFQSLGASIIMGYAAYLMLNVLDNVLDINTLQGIFTQGFVAGIVGVAVGACVLVGLDNPEIKVIWKTLHSRIWRTKPLAESPQELI